MSILVGQSCGRAGRVYCRQAPGLGVGQRTEVHFTQRTEVRSYCAGVAGDGCQEVVDDVFGRVAARFRRGKEASDVAGVVAAGDQRQFQTGLLAHLAQIDVRHQTVADALLAAGIGRLTPFAYKGVDRFGTTAPTDRAIVLL